MDTNTNWYGRGCSGTQHSCVWAQISPSLPVSRDHLSIEGNWPFFPTHSQSSPRSFHSAVLQAGCLREAAHTLLSLLTMTFITQMKPDMRIVILVRRWKSSLNLVPDEPCDVCPRERPKFRGARSCLSFLFTLEVHFYAVTSNFTQMEFPNWGLKKAPWSLPTHIIKSMKDLGNGGYMLSTEEGLSPTPFRPAGKWLTCNSSNPLCPAEN